MVNNTDLFEEIRYLFLITRILGKEKKSIELPPKTLIKMITINAARNFGLENECGSLSQRKDADFLMIDLNDPNFYFKGEERDIYPILVQRTKSENIKKVFIQGESVFNR